MRVIAPELLQVGPEGPRLIGTRCRSCDGLRFPAAIACANPACRDKAVDRTALPAEGTLYSFTVQRYEPPPLFRIDGWKPYAIGLVDLGSGLRIMAILRDIPFDSLKIGMPLRLVLAPLYTDEAGTAVATYMFTSCKKSDL